MPLEPRYSMDEFARRGKEIYHRVVLPATTEADVNKFAAIDIESEDFEIDEDDHQATDKLLARHPDAQMWMMRVGYPTAYRMGRR